MLQRTFQINQKTAEIVLAANKHRRGVILQNRSQHEAFFFLSGVRATTPTKTDNGCRVGPGESFVLDANPPRCEIRVMGGTDEVQSFHVTEW